MKKMMFRMMTVLLMSIVSMNVFAMGDEEETDSAKVVKLMAMLPDYHFVKVMEADENGEVKKNDDGTTVVRYMVATADDRLVSPEVAKKNIQKVLRSSVGSLGKKMGLGALGGALGGLANGGGWKGAAKGAAIGAATGVVAGAGDISQIHKQSKKLKAFNKLLDAYQENFTDEGEPRIAKVDDKKLAKLLEEAPELTKSEQQKKDDLASTEASEDIDEAAINELMKGLV